MRAVFETEIERLVGIGLLAHRTVFHKIRGVCHYASGRKILNQFTRANAILLLFLLMKVCPQCSSVFGDDFLYCSNDGSVLVEENLPLPTEDAEAETVIRRREPIIVDFNRHRKRKRKPSR